MGLGEMWDEVRSVAKAAWSYAGPRLKKVVDQSFEKVNHFLGVDDPEQNLAALNSRKKDLNDQVASMEKEFDELEKKFQKKRDDFSAKQRDLDATQERLLREQESLKKAEAALEDGHRNAQAMALEDRRETEKQVAKVCKHLSKELARYEQDKKELVIYQEKSAQEYAEHRRRLENDYKELKQNQSKIIHLLKTLPAIMKAKELQALTDAFMHNCTIFAEDPDAMVDETRIMQRKYTIKLMEVRNVMQDGHFFPGAMRVWADAAILDLHMLGFLVTNDVFSYRTVEIAKDLYQEYWDNLKMAHKSHRSLTKGSDQLQEIEYLLGSQFRNFDTLMDKSMPSRGLPPYLGTPQEERFESSSNRYFGDEGSQSLRHSRSVREKGTHRRPPVTGGELVRVGDAGFSRGEDKIRMLEQEMEALRMELRGRNNGPANDVLDAPERRHRDPRSSSGILADVPLASGSSRHRGSVREYGREDQHRYSQDHEEYSDGFSSSRNKPGSQLNCREPADLNQQLGFQESRPSSKKQQQSRPGRKYPENKLPSKQKYQERLPSPVDQEESSEESSYSDEQESQPESRGRTSVIKDKRESNKKSYGRRN